jgi:Type II CAAX prenyl endopeptidase Rce1-like
MAPRHRVLTAFEALLFSTLVALYIWRWQEAYPISWVLLPLWLVVSFLAHRDTPQTLGWRADNLWPATRQGLLVFLVFLVAVCAAGIYLGALHRLPEHLVDRRRFLGYFSFCLLQQVALNSYLMNRLLPAVKSQIWTAAICGVIFAALHWPNPVLVPVTLIGGFAMCWLFARQRNILPLTLGQSILGASVWWAFPVAWHHSMRVGPGYYSYAQRLVTW